jgi:hypothetical protein
MHIRTRYRISAIPSFITFVTCASVVALVALQLYDPFAKVLREQLPFLPWVVLGAAIALPLLCGSWYALNFADVRRGRLRVRSLLRAQRVDLKQLDGVYVFARTASNRRRKAHQLLLQLTDADGREAWLPLSVWRDEDLLMARVLRATVECRVPIEGDPMLVKRFSRLLKTYRSWDRQQAAA